MGHEDIERISALIKPVAAEPHRADGRAQSQRGRRPLPPHHRAHARAGAGRGRLRRRCRRTRDVREAYHGGRPCLSRRYRAAARRSTGCRPGTASRTCCTASTFDVRAGEVVTLLGRNGAGKTTTLKSIMGIVGQRTGLGALRGQRADRPARRTAIARLGHRVLPGGARHFREPQRRGEPAAAARGAAGRARARPHLRAVSRTCKERLRSQGTKLSGGEQQMLAIGRILRTGARLLLLDEPTEGLAPVIIQQIGRTIRQLKAAGLHHPAGRAELPLRLDGRRPLLRDGARPDHRHGSPMPSSTPTSESCTSIWGFESRRPASRKLTKEEYA